MPRPAAAATESGIVRSVEIFLLFILSQEGYDVYSKRSEHVGIDGAEDLEERPCPCAEFDIVTVASSSIVKPRSDGVVLKAAAAVAGALASVPPYQRLNLPSRSEELSSIYGIKPHGEVVDELEEELCEEDRSRKGFHGLLMEIFVRHFSWWNKTTKEGTLTSNGSSGDFEISVEAPAGAAARPKQCSWRHACSREWKSKAIIGTELTAENLWILLH